ncbi:response regulator transcription factor [Runella sp.]|uniref:response regulator transcription factor n=1 Tax=Runella sp. TaxID=1960881 RepID=UPI003D0B4905
MHSLKQLEAFLLRKSISLTSQELKILYWAIKGQTNAEIAALLEVSIATVKTHKNNLISKLGVEGKEGFRKFLLEIIKLLQ